ncbi:MAG: adenosine deaminase [Planctomycetota bacterium]|nr:adenosine deaminase [Planctomycetota bacterium]
MPLNLMHLPKAELHVHLEGTLEPDMLLALAQIHGISLPYSSRDEVLAAYHFGSLDDFLKLYYAGMAVLRQPADFTALALAYFTRVASQGVRHAELFFDPQAHQGKGLAFLPLLEGIELACREAASQLGLTSRIIPCILRHLGEDSALRLVDEMLPHRDRIAAVGLDSSEQGNPPQKFTRAFQRVRDAGLKVVAHAGEEGPPDYIRQAIDLLGAERIDHGVRILEDTELTRRVARAGIPLTVCPVCNVRLGVFPSLADHNLPRLLQAGLMVSIHSDDPAYMQAYVGDNYLACQASLGLSFPALAGLAERSFQASFLPDVDKACHLLELRQFTNRTP